MDPRVGAEHWRAAGEGTAIEHREVAIGLGEVSIAVPEITIVRQEIVKQIGKLALSGVTEREPIGKIRKVVSWWGQGLQTAAGRIPVSPASSPRSQPIHQRFIRFVPVVNPDKGELSCVP